MDKKLHYNKYDAGFGFFCAIFLPAVVSLIFITIVSIICAIFKLDAQVVQKSEVYLVLVLIVTPLALFLTFFVSNRHAGANAKVALGLHNKIDIGNIFACIAISLVCVFGIMNFINLFDAVVIKLGFKGNYSLPLPLDSIWWLFANLILVALLPAIFEELVFRGIVFNGLKDYGNKVAVFASAALFMLMHGGIEQTVYPFFVGVVLGFLMLKTNNIIYPIITHFCNNAIVLIFNYIEMQKGISSTTYQFTAYNILFAILLFILSALIICLVIKNLVKGKKSLPRQETPNLGSNKLMYVAIICGIIIWVADLIMGFKA